MPRAPGAPPGPARDNKPKRTPGVTDEPEAQDPTTPPINAPRTAPGEGPRKCAGCRRRRCSGVTRSPGGFGGFGGFARVQVGSSPAFISCALPRPIEGTYGCCLCWAPAATLPLVQGRARPRPCRRRTAIPAHGCGACTATGNARRPSSALGTRRLSAARHKPFPAGPTAARRNPRPRHHTHIGAMHTYSYFLPESATDAPPIRHYARASNSSASSRPGIRAAQHGATQVTDRALSPRSSN